MTRDQFITEIESLLEFKHKLVTQKPLVFLSILIFIVLALIFGSEADKAETFAELVLPPVENKSEGDVNEIDKGEGTWVIAAFEVPESWREYD